MINSRSLEELLPRTKAKALAFIGACDDAGVPVIITSTYRDVESQNALYAQGRSVAGKRVTNAKGGDSFHQYRIAFDFVPVIKGVATWNNDLLWLKCGGIAKACGLEWGGTWDGFKDRPHCQDLNGLSLAEYKLGKV